MNFSDLNLEPVTAEEVLSYLENTSIDDMLNISEKEMEERYNKISCLYDANKLIGR